MGRFVVGVLLPLLLLTAALLNWSLISLVDLAASLFILYKAPKQGFRFKGLLLLWSIINFSLLFILSQVTLLIACDFKGDECGIADSWWGKLVGFMKLQSSVIYYLVLQVFVVFTALIEVHRNKYGFALSEGSWSARLSSIFERLGYHVRIGFCLLVPAIQLVVGISKPSWVSLPFFICSCVGLVDWSLSSNFLGLFRWWKQLWIYAGINIVLLYVYQLPIGFPRMFHVLAEFVGLYKISANSEGLEVLSGVSMMVLYFMLSCVKSDLEDMDCIMSSEEGNLKEHLLPSKQSFFIRESRSGARHANVMIRGAVFRTFSINFFTYGFPVSLFALSYWSFFFASICAFGLLAYVGYVIFVFPSPFRQHRLNGLILVFILCWAVSTYIFNVAYTFLDGKLGKDMEIWEMVGLWHYSIPGLFLLAQFCLGILVALTNLVNNSVLLYMSDEVMQSSCDNSTDEVSEKTEVLIVATIAWGLRKCSRAIMLVLIFLIAVKPGFIHAIYMVFFFKYLMSHSISRGLRQALILVCEVHFAVLYTLQINLVSKSLVTPGSLSMEILSQLGLIDYDSSWDFVKIAVLACFCAIHNHGFEMLLSFSAFVQNTPCRPVGYTILKAGLNKSVLLSIFSSRATRGIHVNPSNGVNGRKITTFLGAISQKILSLYRSLGTYIAFTTIFVAVCLVCPNYVSFGYLFLLLIWITGRQLAEKTKRRLWFPLRAYTIMVFVFVYILSIFPSIETWLSGKLNLYSNFGYSPKAPSLKNLWQSLAIIVVMQLYCYERRQSKFIIKEDLVRVQLGALGFIRRLLIWHSQKLLSAALFYASLCPISACGFLYLLGLVICSNLLKASRIPSKLFIVYTGILVIAEYLFQMWGKHAEMFPNQKHYSLSLVLGIQVYDPGFWGMVAGLRGKVLVIAACSLQYNVFNWLEQIPKSPLDDDRWAEPCPLFVPPENVLPVVSSSNGDQDPTFVSSHEEINSLTSNSWSSYNSGKKQSSHDVSCSGSGSESNRFKKYSFGYIWGSIKEGHTWDKMRIIALKKERFDIQTTTLKTYIMFWIENMFNLFGLEINMITLLLASFLLLNAVSILYVASLSACVLLGRQIIRKMWSIFVFLFASILLLEYFAIWNHVMTRTPQDSNGANLHCHDCWRFSDTYFYYCSKCWLGLVVDDYRILISYYVVFMVACFKLRADQFSRFSGSFTYRKMISQRKNAFVWSDLSFETKSMWTIIDYLRLYCYCHLLDLVLALILVTGTLEYDILHLGYLAFAVIFFRMRLTILKKKNKIFKFLRIYNFIIVVLSLVYQSPFLGDYNAGRCETRDYVYEVIGFYKYDYGFRITSRSAVVEISVFVLVSLQSYMFSSPEFDHVFRYLETEQIGAVVREQEKKAAWKTAQLQHIRENEEKKRQRNLQVEKMKSEMLNLQSQLYSMNSAAVCDDVLNGSEGLRRRTTLRSDKDSKSLDFEGRMMKQEINAYEGVMSPDEPQETLKNLESESSHSKAFTKRLMGMPDNEITELIEDSRDKEFIDSGEENKIRLQGKENALHSSVELIGDGVSEVQSIESQAVNNFLNFFNTHEKGSNNGSFSAQDGEDKDTDILNMNYVQSDKRRAVFDTAKLQIERIFSHIWSQMRSNNDVVCYCCFLLAFLWNFSILSMVYLAALFLYALCINTGPSYIFWVIMLIYTEIYIMVQYLYQIIIQHCGYNIQSTILQVVGFPKKPMTSLFVISLFPLFLVYLSTLLQSFITAKDSGWMSWTEFSTLKESEEYQNDYGLSSSWCRRLCKMLQPTIVMVKILIKKCYRYLKSLTRETESPPYLVQLSVDVHLWPEDMIQPERIESGINQLLRVVHDERCEEDNSIACPCASRVQVQSIKKSEDDPNVALAVFEVVYANSSRECEPTERYKSLTPAADVAKEILIAQQTGVPEHIGFPYSILSVIGGGKREIDLYAYIFGADLSVFFLVAIFYQSVFKNQKEILDVNQLEDQFPKEFVFMLMMIFFLIVLDRIIYLCSFAIGKVIFYLFNLILFTYSVTEYAWQMQLSQESSTGLALRAIYLTKAVSLALQAIQIRYGIPHKSTLYQQFLTSKVSRVNYLGYRVYRALPFLYELRCVLDWSCTTTSLTMYDWLKLEDINASLYLVKCDAVLNRSRHKQGEKQTKMTKFCNGICLFFILIFVIWTPILMYSSGNPTNIANPINDATVQFDIKTDAGRLTLYQTSLCERNPWNKLNDISYLDSNGYLDEYNGNDIQLICCQADASSFWLVPDVVQNNYILSLYSNMEIRFSWVLTRDRPKGKELVKYEKNIDPIDLPKASEIEKVLNGSVDSFRTKNLYPRYFRVTGSGDIRSLEQKVDDVSGDLVLNRGNSEFWSFHDVHSSDLKICGDLTGPMAIIISEETPQGFLGETLSKFSIWGLYITFVLAVGRFIRLQCSDLRMRIPFENLPSCDRLIAFCEDIYAARAEGELGVEEVLYWTVVKIYRSPHMLLEYTKPD
ncbi:piezo-type mechanosensitive ion channel homolog isoform X2 [Daucus carota subsp. sativus]|uniref:piezo-type mechanosensitive ion channel homolog isoform X2 n=1 Tax=Daucus carota subsp. sativus TaxID=79200 RepID=UPI0007EF5071|nr:PREDICTED: piezo-type mechanosensitive ion channel homolog isoform X2 [Daucus carota subsp. sativus]